MNQANPFPGMNPWLETRWPSVHLRLIALMLEDLGKGLPDDLIADGEVRVDVTGDVQRGFRADAAIIAPSELWKSGLPPRWQPEEHGRAVMTAAPVILMVEKERERWVEIRTDAGELVTVIGLLSLANKGSGRLQYVAKRGAYLRGMVNVVEIDLVRAGARTINVDDEVFERKFVAAAEYSVVCVTRPVLPEQREVYYCRLRERLPVIRIPLRVTDHDVVLDLQSLVDRCYTMGRYWKLDYRRALPPPLSPGDLSWALSCLTAAGVLSA